MFKVKGEKPRVGIFEDNVLVSETKHRKGLKRDKSVEGHGESLILAMIPEVSRRKRTKRSFNSEKKNPVSTNSTMSFMGNTAKRTWRSRPK